MREAIAVKEYVPEKKRELSEDAIAEVNKSLLELQKGQIVTVVYYGEREQRYLQITGPVAKVDSYWNTLQIGNIAIDFSEIYELIPC